MSVDKAYVYRGNEMIRLVVTIVIGENTVTREYEFRYFEIEPGKFDVYLTDGNSVSSAERELFDSYYLELVDGKMVARAEEIVKSYEIDYSSFNSFPSNIKVSKIRSATLEISTLDSMMTIYINGEAYYTGRYVYDHLMNAIYPEQFYDSTSLMFSFEITGDDSVKMYDLFPGDEYALDMSSYISLMGGNTIAKSALVRFTANGKCVFYAIVNYYDDYTGKYVDEVLMQVFDYLRTSSGAVILYEDGNPMDIHLRKKDNDTYTVFFGDQNTEMVAFDENGDVFIFYKNGVASCSTSFGLAEFCFYDMLDDDTVLITTIFGLGVIYDIVDGVMYINDDYVLNDELFEQGISLNFDNQEIVIYRYLDSDKVLIKYVGDDKGNGKAISEAYMFGHVIEDGLYYCSFLIFADQLIYDIDGHSVLFAFFDQ